MELIVTTAEDLRKLICNAIEDYFSKYTPLQEEVKTDDKLVTTAELCAYLGITPQTLIRYKKKYKIPFVQLGGSFRYSIPEVKKALKK